MLTKQLRLQKSFEAVKTGISLPECWCGKSVPQARAGNRETSVTETLSRPWHLTRRNVGRTQL